LNLREEIEEEFGELYEERTLQSRIALEQRHEEMKRRAYRKRNHSLEWAKLRADAERLEKRRERERKRARNHAVEWAKIKADPERLAKFRAQYRARMLRSGVTTKPAEVRCVCGVIVPQNVRGRVKHSCSERCKGWRKRGRVAVRNADPKVYAAHLAVERQRRAVMRADPVRYVAALERERLRKRKKRAEEKLK
jgi:hypothetical protein